MPVSFLKSDTVKFLSRAPIHFGSLVAFSHPRSIGGKDVAKISAPADRGVAILESPINGADYIVFKCSEVRGKRKKLYRQKAFPVKVVIETSKSLEDSLKVEYEVSPYSGY